METRLDIALRLRPYLINVALKLSKDRDDAEDIVQDVYAKIWRRIDDPALLLDDENSMMRYLNTAVRNTYYDVVRKRSRAKTECLVLDEGEGAKPLPVSLVDCETPETIAIDSEHNASVSLTFRKGISRLDKPHKDLIKAIVAGETPTEYARRKGTPTGTISFRSWQARQRIKAAIGTSPFAGD